MFELCFRLGHCAHKENWHAGGRGLFLQARENREVDREPSGVEGEVELGAMER